MMEVNIVVTGWDLAGMTAVLGIAIFLTAHSLRQPMRPNTPRRGGAFIQRSKFLSVLITTTAMGLTLAVIWFATEAWRSPSAGAWPRWVGAERNQIGDYVAGFAGALAFLWLAAGYFIQRLDLTSQQRMLARQLKEMRLQRIQSARDLVFRLVEMARTEMNSLSHVIYHRLDQFAHLRGSQYYASLKPQFDTGDKEIFCRQLRDDFSEVPARVTVAFQNAATLKPEFVESTRSYIKVYDTLVNDMRKVNLQTQALPYLALHTAVANDLRALCASAGIRL